MTSARYQSWNWNAGVSAYQLQNLHIVCFLVSAHHLGLIQGVDFEHYPLHTFSVSSSLRTSGDIPLHPFHCHPKQVDRRRFLIRVQWCPIVFESAFLPMLYSNFKRSLPIELSRFVYTQFERWVLTLLNKVINMVNLNLPQWENLLLIVWCLFSRLNLLSKTEFELRSTTEIPDRAEIIRTTNSTWISVG